MARRSDDLPLNKILQHLIQDYQLEEKYLSTKIPVVWKEAVGAFIAERTIKMYVEKNTLIVYFSSAPLKQEVQFNKQKIIDLVNQKLGTDFIKELTIR